MTNKVNAPYFDQARAHLERLKAEAGTTTTRPRQTVNPSSEPIRNAPYADAAREHLNKLKAAANERKQGSPQAAPSEPHPHQWAIDQYGSLAAWYARLDEIYAQDGPQELPTRKTAATPSIPSY